MTRTGVVDQRASAVTSRLAASRLTCSPAIRAVTSLISSVASVRPNAVTAVYAAAKAGLNVLTSVMAQEFAPKGIRVNGIVCGTFWTDSFRAGVPSEEAVAAATRGNVLRRIAQPEEIVGTALYLATEASSYATGQLITVDGGVLP